MPTDLILPFVTLVVGWVLSELGSWFKDHREEKARIRVRDEQKIDRQFDFQRQTLLDLQDKIAELFRLTSEMYRAHIEGDYVTPELKEKRLNLMVRVEVLNVRVGDELLRGQIFAFVETCLDLSQATCEKAANAFSTNGMEFFADLNNRLGALLRSYY
jgi:hypothetical protein